MKRNIVVFGASGGVGSQVVTQALDKGFTVTAIVRDPAAFKLDHPNLTIEKGDGNVPDNLQIRTWDPAFPAADWLATLHRWDIFNAIRTTTGIASFLVMCIVVIFATGKRAAEKKAISPSW